MTPNHIKWLTVKITFPDQYAKDLTMYPEWTVSHMLNYNNINPVLETLEEVRALSGLKVNRVQTKLTIFGCKKHTSNYAKSYELNDVPSSNYSVYGFTKVWKKWVKTICLLKQKSKL